MHGWRVLNAMSDLEPTGLSNQSFPDCTRYTPLRQRFTLNLSPLPLRALDLPGRHVKNATGPKNSMHIKTGSKNITLLMKRAPSGYQPCHENWISLQCPGLIEGIHWHINPDVKIEYISTDLKREEISWVKTTNLKTGEATIFKSTENPLPEEEVSKNEHLVMDCMDCHTRPSHRYASPPSFIDNALTGGQIPKNIPEIKRACMRQPNRYFHKGFSTPPD